MPNLRGASPVGRGEGGQRARQRCRTSGLVSEGARRNDRRGARRRRVGASGTRSEGGRRRPGSVWRGLDRLGATWVGLGVLGRTGPAWAGLGRSGLVWAGLDRPGPVQTGRGGPSDLTRSNRSGLGGAVPAAWTGRFGLVWAGQDRLGPGLARGGGGPWSDLAGDLGGLVCPGAARSGQAGPAGSG